MHSMRIQRMLFKMKKVKKKQTDVICVDQLFCTYCNNYMHTVVDCLEKKIDEAEQEDKIKKSNIPEKYWNEHDPVKSFLMNNSIKGYKNRIFWEKKEISNLIC